MGNERMNLQLHFPHCSLHSVWLAVLESSNKLKPMNVRSSPTKLHKLTNKLSKTPLPTIMLLSPYTLVNDILLYGNENLKINPHFKIVCSKEYKVL